jgi:quercetin dioxygenase-like cupin family protein
MDKIELVPAFSDSRGTITDILENENINAITRITFRKGAVRANHYHKQTTQWNYLISGRVTLVSQIEGQPMVQTILEPGDLAVTEPNVRHALVGIEDAELLVFTRGPRGGKEYESDTFRLETPLVTS